jgi:formylglycine-generating enzyme required for sulfatase activity
MRSFLVLAAALWLGSAGAETFRDCAACPEMVAIPAGGFEMGEAMHPKARPVHTVAVGAFAIGKYEVTQAEWMALMGGNPSKVPACGEACPVENVNWHEAQAFVARLSAQTGKRYRLATEAEWEYACRAGRQEEYCSGAGTDWTQPWESPEYGAPKPVAETTANPWGLHGMSGSVWEWVQDCMHPNYLGAPSDGSAWNEPECKSRVLRGGSWLTGPFSGRAGLRFNYAPDFRARDFGLRVVRTMP